MNLKVYTYPKFGDHCVAFGIIKEFSKLHDKILCYSDLMDDNTFETNKRLFQSMKNVEVIKEPYNENICVRDFGIANTPGWFEKCMPWILDHSLPLPDWFNENWIFDRQWYMNAEVPFEKKWDNFFFERDMAKEKIVFYDILGLKDNEEFIFLQEDPSRNFYLNSAYINKDIKHIEFHNHKDINILDILYTVEKAKEVHTYNTGLATFIDLMNINHPNLYYHKYIRPWAFDQPAMRLNWRIIN